MFEYLFPLGVPPVVSSPGLCAVLSLWLGAVGACVGSFLNVVVYRMPRGMSLVWPGSRCPQCEHPIRWYDNLPILSWLLLRGRCRDCRAPISPRYPLIEGLVATLFVVMAWNTVLIQFPGEFPGDYRSAAETWSILWGRYALHLLLALALIAAAFAELDGRALPIRVPLAVAVIGLIATSLCPVLRAELIDDSPLYDYVEDLNKRFWSLAEPAQLIKGATAALAGLGLGWGVYRLLRALDVPVPRSHATIASLFAVGAVLGWQSLNVMVISAFCFTAQVAFNDPFGARPVSWSAWLAVVTCLHLSLWPFARHYVGAGWPAPEALAVLLVVVILWLAACITRIQAHRSRQQPNESTD
jgi:prepilin signal peptidase PulO-like enzyme (type II secretory pathway)